MFQIIRDISYSYSIKISVSDSTHNRNSILSIKIVDKLKSDQLLDKI